MAKLKAAVIGSGNIGTDLLIKAIRTSEIIEMVAMIGIDPSSDGLARAKRLGLDTTADGIDGFVELGSFSEVDLVFDATSAGAHHRHNEVLQAAGKRMLDLTPAAIGPYVVPAVNLHEHLDAPNINMVTCGGQATVPIVAAINRVAPVVYGEIVSSIASTSSQRPRRVPSRKWAEPNSARQSSCSIRLSLR
jgi:acetaldehyde dehydrogenase